MVYNAYTYPVIFLYDVNFYNLLSVYNLEKHQHIFNPSTKSVQKSKEFVNWKTGDLWELTLL